MKPSAFFATCILTMSAINQASASSTLKEIVEDAAVDVRGVIETKDWGRRSEASAAAALARNEQLSRELVALLPETRRYLPKIIGGNPVAYRQYPWQVALLDRTQPPYFPQFCGGSLVAANWVLTAAHCVDGGTLVSDVFVLAGTDRLDRDGVRHEVAEIIVHEDYQFASTGYDIALLRLKSPSDQPFISLVNASSEPTVAFEGVLGWVTGWGITESGYPSLQLQEVDVQHIPRSVCNSAQMYNGVITETMLCAGYRRGQKDSCQGDSGGPLMVANHRGSYVQFGIVSWGDGCAEENRPGVYTRVAAFGDWIKSHIIPMKRFLISSMKSRSI